MKNDILDKFWSDSLIIAGSAADKSLGLTPQDEVGLDLGISTLCDHMVVSFSTLGIWMGNLFFILPNQK